MNDKLVIRFWWIVMRIAYLFYSPIQSAYYFACDKWEIAANQWWIDHPEELEKLLEDL